MANEDEERLIVFLEARIKDLEKNMAKGVGITAKAYREMSLNSRKATDNMERDMIRTTTRINQALATTSTKIGDFGKAMIGGFIGGAFAGGLAGVVAGIRQVADAVAEVGDQAKMAGLSTKAFQEWKFVAEQARIPVDAITDGLKELQLRADEFAVTGKGSAAEAFQRLGMTPAEVKERLKDPSELLLLIIERTRKLKDTAAGIRIFDELFGGTGGERMVSLLQQGEGAIRDQIKAANDLGLVMDDELIQKAAEIDQKFNTIANTVGVTLKSAIVSAADSLMEFIEGFRAFEEQRTSTLQKATAELGMKRVELENERMQIQGGESGNWLYRNPEGPAAKGRLDQIEKELAKLNEQDAQIAGVVYNRVEPMNRSGNDKWEPKPYTAPADEKKKGRKDPYERETQQIKDRTAALYAETAAQAGLNPLVNDFGFTVARAKAAQELLTAAQKAGTAAGKELKDVQQLLSGEFGNLSPAARQQAQAMLELASNYGTATEASERFKEKQQEIKQQAEDTLKAGKDLISSTIDGFLEGEKAIDVLANSLKRLGKSLIDNVLNNLFKIQNAGGGGGFLDGLFSFFGGGGGSTFTPTTTLGNFIQGIPGFDGGGHTGMGARSGGLDGKGGFLAMLHPRETVTDHTKGGAQMAPSLTVPISITIDATGADAAGLARVEQQLATLEATLPNRIVATVKNAQQRRGL